MPTHETVNGLGLTYKGTVGISSATIPDVCKTPSPAGPVPIPYPNIAQHSSLENGTKTVFAKGKMIAIKGSHYSRSNGDEAGTAGGVKSSVNMKATDWITYSFDVKMDGKNACRHTDKKFHNNQNTVDLQGNIDAVAAAVAEALVEVARACDKAVNDRWDNDHPNGPKHDDCWADTGETMKTRNGEEPKPVQVKLGELKEDCVNALVADTEVLRKQQNFDSGGTPRNHPTRGGIRPDFIVLGEGGVNDVIGAIDLKFPCPSEKNKTGRWRDGQKENYRSILNVEPRGVCPQGVF